MIRAGRVTHFDSGQVSPSSGAPESDSARAGPTGAPTAPAAPDRTLPMTDPTRPPATPRHKLTTDILILVALVVLGAAGYWLAPLLTPRSDITLPLSDCDLNRTPCTIALPGGSTLEVAIGPRPIPVLKPLKIEARARDGKVSKVEIDFAGIDMKMGYNRPRLESLGDGRFAGEASLPVCITGGMEWEATVIVETRGAVVAAPFRFRTEGS